MNSPDPVLVQNFWLLNRWPFDRFIAMTVYPSVYLRGTEINVVTLAHEKIHLIQQSKARPPKKTIIKGRLRFFVYFLPLYFLKWIFNMFRYGPLVKNSEGKLKINMKPYFAIDWEREAYVLTTPGLLTNIGYPDLDSNPFDNEG